MEQRLINANDLINNAMTKTFGLRVCDIDNAQTILVIPENPTNGDMIKAIFLNAPIDTELYTNYVMVKLDYHTQYDGGLMFDKDWWNAPYRVESEE